MDGSIKMTYEMYLNTLSMMRSPDTENQVVALNCMENMDFKSNTVPFILLMMS